MLGSIQQLTPREKEIVTLAWHGLSSREMAARLSISLRTVEVHRANVMRKWGVNNVAGLLRTALQQKIVTVRT